MQEVLGYQVPRAPVIHSKELSILETTVPKLYGTWGTPTATSKVPGEEYWGKGNSEHYRLYKFTFQAKYTACPISLSCLVAAESLICF